MDTSNWALSTTFSSSARNSAELTGIVSATAQNADENSVKRSNSPRKRFVAMPLAAARRARSILLEKGVEKAVVIVLCAPRCWQELTAWRFDAFRQGERGSRGIGVARQKSLDLILVLLAEHR